jgi:hypothetical protein
MATVENGCQLGALGHRRDQMLVQDLGIYLAIVLEVDWTNCVVDALSAYVDISAPSIGGVLKTDYGTEPGHRVLNSARKANGFRIGQPAISWRAEYFDRSDSPGSEDLHEARR